MSKRDKKRKKKQQGQGDEYAGVGLLSSMRGGFKNAVGTGDSGKGSKTTAGRIKDIAFWIVIAALLMLMFYRFGVRR